METAGEEGGEYVWEQKSLRLQRDLTWEGRGSQKQRPPPMPGSGLSKGAELGGWEDWRSRRLEEGGR